MKKKMLMKKVVPLVMAVTMTVMIAGCGNRNAGKEKDTTDDTKQSVTTTDSNQTETGNNEMERDLKELSGTGDSYDAEAGRYYIAEDEEENKTIRYIDYKAKKEVYLCNKLNCKHNNKNCTAVLPNQDYSMESWMFGDETYLYLLMTPYDSSGSMEVNEINAGVEDGISSISSGSNEPPAIYRMNRDGTDREKIFEFESGIIAEQHVMGDGKYLYVVTKEVKRDTKGNVTYNTGYNRKLVKIDLEKGTSEDVMNLKKEQAFMGCSGRNIIVCEDDFGRELSPQEYHDDDKYKELYEKSKDIISSINVDKKNVTELKSIKNSNEKIHGTRIYGDKLYITYEGQKFIEIIDLKSGEVKKLKVDDSYMVENIVSPKNGADVIVGIRYSDIAGGDEKGYSSYLINTENGEVTKSMLQNRYHKPITIEGENENYLYVNSNYKNDTEYIAWADVNQEYISEVEYSIISKEDYLANQPKYQKIKLLNGGKLHD